MSTEPEIPQEGQLVLWEYGRAYDSTRKKSIRTIEKVLKMGYRLSGEPDIMFGFNGYQKGLGGRQNMATISHCTIITKEEAEGYRILWTTKRKVRALVEELTPLLSNASLDQLEQIKTLLVP